MPSEHNMTNFVAAACFVTVSIWAANAQASQNETTLAPIEASASAEREDDLSWLPSSEGEDWLPDTTPSSSDKFGNPDDVTPEIDYEGNSRIFVEEDSVARAKPLGFEVRAWAQSFRYDFEFADLRGDQNILRGTVDYNGTHQLGAASLTISNRFDLSGELNAFPEVAQGTVAINALRETYFSTPIKLSGNDESASFYFDIGRINVRNGVTSGYSPVDVFKDGAVVSSTSFDPGAQRLNRLGTVMARAQVVGDWGSASVAVVPKLQARDDSTFVDESTFDLRLDRTNFRNSLYAKFSPAIGERASLDLFAYAPENMTTLFGAASSVLLSDSIVFNAESALVRAERENLLSDESAYKSWNARVSANIVWTLEGGIELIGEVSHAGDAIGRSQWRQVRNSIDPNVISRLNEFRTTRSRMSEPLVKDGYFTSANWRDAFGRQGLDLSVFATGNFYDASLLWQTSITQDFKRGTSAGLIASGFEGTPTSEFGSSPLETYIAVFVGKTF